ncbi:MAG: YlmH/Sll1252 family protein [Clostridia bacterium]|jgi:RNA-binding protein YlmH|nr:YlmH/Sll1252 family protein [Clostridia bacterium]
MRDKDELIRHVEEDKKIYARSILDKIDKVLFKNICVYTNFLDPYEISIAESILNRFEDLKYEVIGGYEGAERNVLVIYPSFFCALENKDVVAIEIKGDFKFNKISHRNYMGSILNLGISKEVIGDIIIHENYGQIIIKEDIKEFIIDNLKKIGRETISVKEISLSDIEIPAEKYEIINMNVTSMRLDAFVASLLKTSRSEAIKYIDNDKIKVNFKLINKKTYTLKEEDLLSIRGHGRFVITSNIRKTKKDRLFIEVKRKI